MRVRLLALTAAGGIAVAALPAHAATGKPQITDPTGDANGVNQQFPGLGPNPPSENTAPADVAAAVITGNTITWRVPRASIPVGTVFSDLNAQTRQEVSSPVVSATVPQYDYATGTATFTVGR